MPPKIEAIVRCFKCGAEDAERGIEEVHLRAMRDGYSRKCATRGCEGHDYRIVPGTEAPQGTSKDVERVVKYGARKSYLGGTPERPVLCGGWKIFLDSEALTASKVSIHDRIALAQTDKGFVAVPLTSISLMREIYEGEL